MDKSHHFVKRFIANWSLRNSGTPAASHNSVAREANFILFTLHYARGSVTRMFALLPILSRLLWMIGPTDELWGTGRQPVSLDAND